MNRVVNLYVLRPAELVLKSAPVRRRMMDLLRRNLEAGLRRRRIPFTLHRTWDRFLLEAPEEAEAILSRLFGLRSFSPVIRLPSTELSVILERGREIFAPLVAGKTFAVRARRSPAVRLSSRAVERELGARLVEAGGRVDLTHPQITCHVDIREGETFFYHRRIPGPGGLPLGADGPTLVLLSGGFDSAVAAWTLMNRGVLVRFLFFELGGCAHRAGVLGVALKLFEDWMFGDEGAWVDILPGQAIVNRLRERVPERFWNVMLKRVFYQVARRVAEREGLLGFATGEAVGQVSSQTLKNLAALSAGFDSPVWRPLLATEKEAIIARAREIGTAAISERVAEYCAITPRKPATRTDPSRVMELETHLGGAAWYDELAARWERVWLRELDWVAVHHLEVSIDDPPPDAVWIDLRKDGPPLPVEALRFSPAELQRHLPRLDPSRTYVLVCPRGSLSADLAHLMRSHGLRAYAYRGGASRLLRHSSVPDNPHPSPRQES